MISTGTSMAEEPKRFRPRDGEGPGEAVEDIQWKAVPGYEKYEISTDGQARRGGKLLKPFYNDGDYQISLSKDGKKKLIRLGRVMLTIFVRPPVTGEELKYLDGNRCNCTLSNLAWRYGHTNTRLSALQRAEIIDKLTHGLTQVEIASQYGVSQVVIWRINKFLQNRPDKQRQEKRKGPRPTPHAQQPYRQITAERFLREEQRRKFILEGLKIIADMTGEMTGIDIRKKMTDMGIVPPSDWSMPQQASAWANLVNTALTKKLLLKTGNLRSQDTPRRGRPGKIRVEKHILYIRSDIPLRLPEWLR